MTGVDTDELSSAMLAGVELHLSESVAERGGPRRGAGERWAA